MELFSPEIVSVLENKELLSHFRVYGKSATSAQTDRRITTDEPLYTEESSCARKKTVDIGILVTSRNSDRKIMQSIRITSIPPSRTRKWNVYSSLENKEGRPTPYFEFCMDL